MLKYSAEDFDAVEFEPLPSSASCLCPECEENIDVGVSKDHVLILALFYREDERVIHIILNDEPNVCSFCGRKSLFPRMFSSIDEAAQAIEKLEYDIENDDNFCVNLLHLEQKPRP